LNVAYYLAFALLGVLTFAVFLRLARRGTRAALAGYAFALVLLLLKAGLNHRPDWEFRLFGGWTDYVFLQSYLIFPLGLACLGLAAGLLPPGRNRRAVTILAGFLVLVSLWTERWMFVEPDTHSTARADEEHYCAQTTNFSCGPAACVSLLSQMGVDATEGEMMGLCRTPSYGGTSLFRIARGLQRKLGDGYDVRIVDGDPDFLRQRGGSAILTVNKVHAVALHFDRDRVIVRDPAIGTPKTIPFDTCAARYGGPAVIVDRR